MFSFPDRSQSYFRPNDEECSSESEQDQSNSIFSQFEKATNIENHKSQYKRENIGRLSQISSKFSRKQAFSSDDFDDCDNEEVDDEINQIVTSIFEGTISRQKMAWLSNSLSSVIDRAINDLSTYPANQQKSAPNVTPSMSLILPTSQFNSPFPQPTIVLAPSLTPNLPFPNPYPANFPTLQNSYSNILPNSYPNTIPNPFLPNSAPPSNPFLPNPSNPYLPNVSPYMNKCAPSVSPFPISFLGQLGFGDEGNKKKKKYKKKDKKSKDKKKDK